MLSSDSIIVIPLTKGQQAIIDPIDADLAQFKWTTMKGKHTFYAYRNTPNHPEIKIYLHRIILERMIERDLLPFPNEQVDHVDRNGLNNRRENLRLANNAQNNMNKLEYSHNTSGHRGVSWRKDKKKFEAYIGVDKRRIRLGYFATYDDAVKARLDAEKLYYGDFAPKFRYISLGN